MPFGAESEHTKNVRRLSLETALKLLPGAPASLSTSPICLRASDQSDLLVFLCHDASAQHLYLDINSVTDRTNLYLGLMDRIPGTGSWLAGFEVPSDWRGSYSFIPLQEIPEPPAERNHPDTRAWWLGVLAGAIADPLNPYGDYAARLGGRRSVTQGHTAAALPERSQSAPRGLLQTLHWTPSNAAHPARNCWLYTPAGDSQELPLVVLFDGQVWSQDLHLEQTLDALIAVGELPPLAVLMIDSLDGSTRSSELPRNAAFINDVADSLLPLVQPLVHSAAAHRLSRRAGQTVVCGQSFGGLAAFFAARLRPEVFGSVLSQSGSFWWPDIDASDGGHTLAELQNGPRMETRVVLQFGSLEGSLTDSNRALAAALAQLGVDAQCREISGGHDWAWWHAELGAGLNAALSPTRVLAG